MRGEKSIRTDVIVSKLNQSATQFTVSRSENSRLREKFSRIQEDHYFVNTKFNVILIEHVIKIKIHGNVN